MSCFSCRSSCEGCEENGITFQRSVKQLGLDKCSGANGLKRRPELTEKPTAMQENANLNHKKLVDVNAWFGALPQ